MDHDEFTLRMQREVLDSYDEELELELEDRPFDASGNEVAALQQQKRFR